jgi:HlyD family secretion protein
LIRIAGPSGEAPVIAELRVDDGDTVTQGQVIAILDTAQEREARIESLEAELSFAERQLARQDSLHTEAAVSASVRDEWETRVRVARANLREARAALARAQVRSPISGRVIEVHARQGERVGAEGIVELGRTDHMFAVAEVYETDSARVRVGQRAWVTSLALPEPLTGKVDWIRLKVAKQDALGTDPASRKDARVVEVEIRLDDSQVAQRFTHLQVEIEIETDP